jgi:hypothetical protein
MVEVAVDNIGVIAVLSSSCGVATLAAFFRASGEPMRVKIGNFPTPLQTVSCE